MVNEKGKTIGLIVAIVLALTLLIIAMIINTVRKQKERPVPAKIELRKKSILKPKTALPQIEDFEEKKYLTEKHTIKQKSEEEKPALMRLKDLPLKKISPEEILEEKKQEGDLEISPSPDEVKELKRKGLIIF
ncbi:MAG: hypothetical protein KKH29_03760 [Candidatus Omnitrophica bacterium]|nr:hypothetical protein [Candidatus Omnitrophota bacterium]